MRGRRVDALRRQLLQQRLRRRGFRLLLVRARRASRSSLPSRHASTVKRRRVVRAGSRRRRCSRAPRLCAAAHSCSAALGCLRVPRHRAWTRSPQRARTKSRAASSPARRYSAPSSASITSPSTLSLSVAPSSRACLPSRRCVRARRCSRATSAQTAPETSALSAVRQLPLRLVGKQLVQPFGHHQPEHAVAEELQPLVMSPSPWLPCVSARVERGGIGGARAERRGEPGGESPLRTPLRSAPAAPR